MEIKFNVTKEERKAFITAISELTGWAAVYKGAPSFAYAVNNYIIDKNGMLIYDERTSTEDVQILLTGLTERGFTFEGDINEIAPLVPKPSEIIPNSDISGDELYDGASANGPASDEDSIDEILNHLVVEIPLDGFTQTALDNLKKLIDGKAALIRKAIGTDALPIERTVTTLRFPWFHLSGSPQETDAYIRFVSALCEMAKKQKRVTLKETPSDSENSEKFAFRCFLLRLGFIGKEYSAARKILLSKLSGSAAFRSGNHNNSDEREDVTPTDSNEETEIDATSGEDEIIGKNAETSGEKAVYTYNPNLSDYDALIKRGN